MRRVNSRLAIAPPVSHATPPLWQVALAITAGLIVPPAAICALWLFSAWLV